MEPSSLGGILEALSSQEAYSQRWRTWESEGPLEKQEMDLANIPIQRRGIGLQLSDDVGNGGAAAQQCSMSPRDYQYPLGDAHVMRDLRC
jgi:hypothetical protein